MRTAPLLVLAAVAPFASTAPSPGLVQQHPLANSPPSARHSSWRCLSDRLISTLWRIDTTSTSGSPSRSKQWKAPPTHTRSRHGEDLLLRFNITTAQEAASLKDVADFMYLDVWDYTNDWVDIRLAKDVLPHVLDNLPPSLQHAHTPLLQERELAQAIYDTYPSPRPGAHQAYSPASHQAAAFGPALRPTTPMTADTNVFFADYQPLSVIHPWLRLLASLFTTHVRPVTIGYSFEGRGIHGLRVGVHPTNDDDQSEPRKTVLITGGLHAREWISVSTVNYLAYSLITSYGKNPTITSLLEDFDFVFLPTVNPDGYVYSWENDRLWRKNRQRTSMRLCHGVDLDRSFGFEWDGASTAGNPCSESYAGETAFDAIESARLAEWARNETANNNVAFVGFLDLHSYSQQILYPYSYSCANAPPSLENLQELAAGLAKAIRLNRGHAYEARPACEGNVAVAADGARSLFPRFETGGGSALDWFYHELGVRFAYQIKLRDRGSYGFLLPKDHIVPTGKEMLDAIVYFGKYLGLQYAEEKQLRRTARSGGDGFERVVRKGSNVDAAADDDNDDDAVEGAPDREAEEDPSAYVDLKRRRRR